MAYKIKKKKIGRPRAYYKERGIKGLTPKGYEYMTKKKGKLIFRKKRKK
jgi:hypothetical protein